MRSACAFALAILIAGGTTRAQQPPSPGKPAASAPTILTITISMPAQGAVVVTPHPAAKVAAVPAKPPVPSSPVRVAPTATMKPAIAFEAFARPFLAVDANRDGSVCKDEFLKAQAARFDKLDLDKNGVITQNELRKDFQAYVATVQMASQPVKAAAKPAASAKAVVGPAPKVKGAKRPAVATPAARGPKTADCKATPSAKTSAVQPAKMPVPISAPAVVTQTPAPTSRIMQGIAALDRDRDGKITRHEYMKVRMARFAMLDLDKNGAITPAELSTGAATMKPARPGRPVKAAAVSSAPGATAPARSQATRMSARLMALDVNHDGKVTRAEFAQGLKTRFTALDTDRDGVLARTEIARAFPVPKSGPAPLVQFRKAPPARPTPAVKPAVSPAKPPGTPSQPKPIKPAKG